MVEDNLLETDMSDDIIPIAHMAAAEPREAATRPAASQRSVLDDVLSGPIQLLAVVGGLALLVALGLLVTVSWRGLQRLEPFYVHLEQQERLQQIERRIDNILALHAVKGSDPSSSDMDLLKVQLTQLIGAHVFSDPTSAERLREAIKSLNSSRAAAENAEDARARISQVLDHEKTAGRSELSGIRHGARAELMLAAVALLVLPCTALLVMIILRDHITRPLRDLSRLLNLIGEAQYRPAPAGDVAVTVRPIMEGYNRLVDRLTKALQTNKRYQDQLQAQVQAAAETLVRQRVEIAEADRLSAVGEMSARVAHELRNPLAGIKIALANLTQDSVDDDQRERLQLIAAEVDRMARLLDHLLVRARRQPEAPTEVDVRALVSDLLALARYQVPDRIALDNSTPAGVVCRLQRDGVRQMLLNLVLNASQAIGESPGTISVTACRENQMLRLSVVDDGPGFSKDLIEGGVRPFLTQRAGGSGLGLSTVQRMVQAMGGKLELSNREPRGAVVTLSVVSSEAP